MGKGTVRRSAVPLAEAQRALEELQHARAQRAHVKAVRKREKRLARARWRLPRYAGASLGTAVLAGPVLSAAAWEVGLGTASVVTALVAGRAALLLRRPPEVPDPPALPLPPPPPGSAARPHLDRLDRLREELRRLLPLVGPDGRAAAVEAWEAAASADTALRLQAARLAAVEPHRGVDPVLLQRLSDGVAAGERLLQAVCDLVAASDPDEGGRARLQDAADRLHGLADGLRAVR